MRKSIFLLALLYFCVIFIQCSTQELGEGFLVQPEAVSGDIPELNVNPVGGFLFAFTPANPHNFTTEIVSENANRVIIRFSGVTDFVFTPKNDLFSYFKGYGSIDYIEVEFQIVDSKRVGPGQITKISGMPAYSGLAGNTLQEWYPAGMDSGECSNDSDCESILNPTPPYKVYCDDGTCIYVMPE